MCLFNKKYSVNDLIMCEVRQYDNLEYILVTKKNYNKVITANSLFLKSADGRMFDRCEVITATPLVYIENDRIVAIINDCKGKLDRNTACEIQHLLTKRRV